MEKQNFGMVPALDSLQADVKLDLLNDHRHPQTGWHIDLHLNGQPSPHGLLSHKTLA